MIELCVHISVVLDLNISDLGTAEKRKVIRSAELVAFLPPVAILSHLLKLLVVGQEYDEPK